jgi:hypothetical protein
VLQTVLTEMISQSGIAFNSLVTGFILAIQDPQGVINIPGLTVRAQIILVGLDVIYQFLPVTAPALGASYRIQM